MDLSSLSCIASNAQVTNDTMLAALYSSVTDVTTGLGISAQNVAIVDVHQASDTPVFVRGRRLLSPGYEMVEGESGFRCVACCVLKADPNQAKPPYCYRILVEELCTVWWNDTESASHCCRGRRLLARHQPPPPPPGGQTDAQSDTVNGTHSKNGTRLGPADVPPSVAPAPTFEVLLPTVVVSFKADEMPVRVRTASLLLLGAIGIVAHSASTGTFAMMSG